MAWSFSFLLFFLFWQYLPQVFFIIAGSLFAVPIFSTVATVGMEIVLKWRMVERLAEAEEPGESEQGGG